MSIRNTLAPNAGQLVVGVLGGMGPQATVDFLAKLIQVTPVGTEQEHLRVLIDCNPKVPDRNRAVAGEGISPVLELVMMATGLERAGADMLVMACNTAHAFEPAIRRAISIPFVSIVEEACDACAREMPAAHGIGVLAAPGCIRAGLYQSALRRRGFEAILLEPHEQAMFDELLYQIKAGSVSALAKRQMRDLGKSLISRGADVVVAACTEVPLVLSQDDLARPFVDATHNLAVRCVHYARRLEPISSRCFPEERGLK